MTDLIKFEEKKPVRRYDHVRTYGPDGRNVNHHLYETPQPNPSVVIVKNELPPVYQTPAPNEPATRKGEGLDTVSFMVLANSIVLFFLLILIFIKTVIG